MTQVIQSIHTVRRVTLIALAVWIGAISRPESLAAPPQKPIFVGILRQDGLLIPIAIHDGSDWWNRWPFSNGEDESVLNLPLPATIARIPTDWLPVGVTLPIKWRTQLERGGSRPIQLLRPARPKRFILAAMIAIQTNYPSSHSEEILDDGEAGVSISGSAELGRFVAVNASSEEATRLIRATRPSLNDAETQEITFRTNERQSQPDWNHQPVVFPATESKRASMALQEIAISRAERREAGRTFYYLTALKDYGAKPYPDCDATVDFAAVVVGEPDGRFTKVSSSAYTILECSRDYGVVIKMQLLATLHWAGPTLWVVRWNAEDGFDYSLVNPAVSDPSMGVQIKGLWQTREHGRISRPSAKRPNSPW